jgi:ubiquinone/menaquinone biosynthesis C-methylase UbiE
MQSQRISSTGTDASRVVRSRDETRASYDQLSRWYDWLSRSAEQPMVQDGLRMLDAQEGERILEVGSGTGQALVQLARSVGASGSVCGLDISSGMLRASSAKVRATALNSRVVLHCADATTLPFKSGLFDAIFMSFTLELFDAFDIPVVLSECGRVLREGGRICVVALSNRGGATLVRRLYEWARRLCPRFVDCRPIFARAALGQAGFDTASVAEPDMWGLPVEVVVAVKSQPLQTP